jgi:hypothetical protein
MLLMLGIDIAFECIVKEDVHHSCPHGKASAMPCKQGNQQPVSQCTVLAKGLQQEDAPKFNQSSNHEVQLCPQLCANHKEQSCPFLLPHTATTV